MSYHRTRGSPRWENAMISGFLGGESPGRAPELPAPQASLRRCAALVRAGGSYPQPCVAARHCAIRGRIPAKTGQNPENGTSCNFGHQVRTGRHLGAISGVRILTGFPAASTHATRVRQRDPWLCRSIPVNLDQKDVDVRLDRASQLIAIRG